MARDLCDGADPLYFTRRLEVDAERPCYDKGKCMQHGKQAQFHFKVPVNKLLTGKQPAVNEAKVKT